MFNIFTIKYHIQRQQQLARAQTRVTPMVEVTSREEEPMEAETAQAAAEAGMEGEVHLHICILKHKYSII